MPETTLAIRLTVRDINEARTLLRSLGVDGDRALDKLEVGARDADRGMGRLDQRLHSVERRLIGFGRAALGAAAAFAGFSSIQGEFRRLTDVALQFERVQRTLDFSFAQRGAKELEFLRKESDRLNFTLLDTAEQYAKFSAGAKAANVSVQGIRDTFLGVVEAGRTLGLANDQVSRALRALEQIASKGRVSMEELRQQLGEAIPGAFGIAARSMGLTNKAFEELVKAGLPAQQFLESFGDELRDRFSKAAKAAADDLQGAITRFGNSADELRLAFLDTGVIEEFTELLLDLAELLRDPTVAEGMRLFSRSLDDIVKSAVNALVPLVGLRDTIQSLFDLDIFKPGSVLQGGIKSLLGIDVREAEEAAEAVRRAGEAMGAYAQGGYAAGDAGRDAAKAAAETAQRFEELYDPISAARSEQLLLLDAYQKGEAAGDAYARQLEIEADQRKTIAELQKDGVELSESEIDLIRLTVAETHEAENAIKDLAEARREDARAADEQRRAAEQARKELLSDISSDFKIKQRENEKRRRDEERDLEKQRQLAQDRADLLNEPIRNALASLQNEFASTLDELFRTSTATWTDIWDSFTSIASRALAELVSQRIFVNVAANVVGGAGAFGGPGGGGIPGITGGSGFLTGGGPIGLLAPDFANSINKFGAPFFRHGSTPGAFGTATTLTGALGAGAFGAAAGGILPSLLGLGGSSGLGGRAGGGLGAGIGSLFGPVGAVAGGLGGSLFGGLIGSLFGGRPSDSSQDRTIDLKGVRVSFIGGQTGDKFSEENARAADQFSQTAVQLTQSLQQLLGVAGQGDIALRVGSRDGLRLARDGGEFQSFGGDQAAFTAAIVDAIRDGFDVGGTVGRVLRRSDAETPEQLLADVQFGQLFEELTNSAEPLVRQLQAMRDQFRSARSRARELGLATGVLVDAQRAAVREFRTTLYAELQQLGGLATGALGPFAQQLEALQDRFRQLISVSDELGLNEDKLRDIRREGVRNIRASFREQVNATFGVQQSINQQVAALREQARALRREARDIGVNPETVSRQFRQARAQLREQERAQRRAEREQRRSAIDALRDRVQALGGGATTFTDRLGDLVDAFRDAAKEARQLGINTAFVTRERRDAIKALKDQFRAEVEAAREGLRAQADQARAFFDSILDPLRAAQQQFAFQGLSPQTAFGELQSQFLSTGRAAEAGDLRAIEQLPTLASQLAEVASDFGGSGLLATVTKDINNLLGRVINQTEQLQSATLSGLPAVVAATDRNTRVIADTLKEELGEVVAAVRKLERQLARVT